MLFTGVQTLFIFFLIFILTISVVQWWRRSTNFKQRYPGCKLPPLAGPRGFSLVGSISCLGRDGNDLTFNLTGQNVLVLSGFEAVSEALVKHSTVFAGRPHLALTQELTDNQDSRPVPCTDNDAVQSEQDYLHILREQESRSGGFLRILSVITVICNSRRSQNSHMSVPAPRQTGISQGDGPPFIPLQGDFSLTENGRIVAAPSDQQSSV